MNEIYNQYTTHLDIIVDLAITSRALGLNLDVMGMREELYQIHKQKNGTGKVYDGESYQRFMLGRYLNIECTINQRMEELR